MNIIQYIIIDNIVMSRSTVTQTSDDESPTRPQSNAEGTSNSKGQSDRLTDERTPLIHE